MSATYNPKTVASLTGVSIAGVRNYTNRPELAPFFSESARPGPGEARAFTADDVRLVAFVKDRTDQGLTYDQVAQAIHSGEFEEFSHWSPPEPEEAATRAHQVAAGEESTALVTGANAQALADLLDVLTERQLQALAPILDDMRAGVAQERARADQLAEEVKAERARADRYRSDVQATIETYEEGRAELREELGRLRGQLEEIKAARARRPAWLRWIAGS